MSTETASGLQMDWAACLFTPNGGTSVPITEVKDVGPHDGGSAERWYADASKYPTAMRTVNNTATVKITSGNIAALRSIPYNTLGTLTFTHNDYMNGTGSGAIVYTLASCQRIAVEDSGGNNQFGVGTINFEGVSSDGVTSPLTSVVTP